MKKIICIILFAAYLSAQVSYAQADGDSLFESNQIHNIKLYFAQAKWYDSLIVYKPLDKKMMGNVNINGRFIDSVGVQFKGNSSFNAPGVKKPWKIDFNEYSTGTKYDGLKTINLNNAMKDPSFMREKIFDDFCRRVGVEAPRATYANVYVNDTLWGFYTLVEQCDKTMLNTQIGNNGGNLFKGDPNGTLQWYGSAASSYYGKYELKTNKTANDWTDLIHLIDEINNTPSVNFYDSLEKSLNTKSWIEGWAANIMFVNLDSYNGTGHNYYLYHNSATNKFDFIIWDTNEAFGNFNFGMSISQLESLSMSYIPNPATGRPLTDKMLQNTAYKNTYVNTVCNYVTDYFSNIYLDPKIDSLANLIRPYVYADPHKPYTNANFETNITSTVMGNIAGLKSFIANRRINLLSQLAAYNCFMGTEEFQEEGYKFQVSPNPNNGMFNVQCLMANENISTINHQPLTIEIYNALGELTLATTVNSKPETINLRQTSGIYFYRILSGEDSVASGKLVVE
ncbi:MAG: T9SS type A sorting domain-containing protein [Bacteroidetes bacterium]|nr:MAG: T9SS type A sorting domain-containing protein [Bacteroidota bacterium]